MCACIRTKLGLIILGIITVSSLTLAWEPNMRREVVANQVFTANQISTFGNRFYVEWNYVQFKLDNPNKSIALRFTALNSKTLNAIHVFSTYVPKGAPIVTLQLRTDDGSPNHFPGSAVLVEKNITTFPSSNYKWIRVAIPSITLIAGNIYHIVMFSRNSDVNNNWEYRATKPLNEFWINNLSNFRGVLTSAKSPSAWVDQSAEPIYVLEFADGTREGNPYTGSYKRPVWGSWKQGENFLIETEICVSALSMRASKQGNPPDNLYIVLTTAENPNRNGTLIARGVAATSENVPSFPKWDWVTLTLPSPITLSPGRYRIYLESPLSNENNCYLQDQDIATPGYEDLTYGGYESCYAEQRPGEQTTTGYWGLEHYVDHAFALEIFGTPKVWERPFSVESVSDSITCDIEVSGVKIVNFPQTVTVTIYNGRLKDISGTLNVQIFFGNTLRDILEKELPINISAKGFWSKSYSYVPSDIGEYKIKVSFIEKE
jgi:hypothetical protein